MQKKNSFLKLLLCPKSLLHECVWIGVRSCFVYFLLRQLNTFLCKAIALCIIPHLPETRLVMTDWLRLSTIFSFFSLFSEPILLAPIVGKEHIYVWVEGGEKYNC